MTNTIIEKREVPQWVSDHITSKGGLNPYGLPNFRVVWGGNRTYVVGGKFKEVVTFNDEDGNQRAIVTDVAQFKTLYKYHTGRWHMERWRGPEFYGTREEWYQNTWDEECQFHTMGDYPDRGDYEHVFFLAQCPHMQPGDKDWCMLCQVSMGQYIDLEPNIEVLDMQIQALQDSENVTAGAQFAALFMREDLKRRINNKVISERVRGAMRPKLATQPTSWQTGDRCSVPEAKFKSRVPVRPELGFSQIDHKPKTEEN